MSLPPFSSRLIADVGISLGDEGKGRVVDFFARECTMIGRYSAGSNAGHTIVNERGRFALQYGAGLVKFRKVEISPM